MRGIGNRIEICSAALCPLLGKREREWVCVCEEQREREREREG
jgi:hypothetical protein